MSSAYSSAQKRRDSIAHYTAPTAGKLNLAKCVFIYMIGGTLGTLWEVIFNLIKLERYVECSGSIFTPFNPVYGCGALVIVWGLKKFREPWQVFTLGTLAGGALEYFLSYCEETILGTRSWNYKGWFLSINGRTTVPIMLFWGVLCLVVVFVVYKPLDKLFEALPRRAFKIVGWCFFALLCIDMFITVSAMFRYVGRNSDMEAFTVYGQWLDKVFDNDFMRRKFPSMKIQ